MAKVGHAYGAGSSFGKGRANAVVVWTGRPGIVTVRCVAEPLGEKGW